MLALPLLQLLFVFFGVALTIVKAISDDEIDALCIQRDDIHCINMPDTKLLANTTATIDTLDNTDFVAQDFNPARATAAVPDPCHARVRYQCLGDPAVESWTFVFSNKDGSTITADAANKGRGQFQWDGNPARSAGSGVGLRFGCKA